MTVLQKIQSELKAPKGQFNSFGKYKYRSCEDIVEAAKPVLAKYSASLVMSDEIVMVGERVYVKATATITGDGWKEQSTAYAREPEEKKGMDPSQITGTASSYARKYALNGLLAIDDTKDADTDEHAAQTQPKALRGKDKELAQQYVRSMVDALEAQDGLALRELGDELRENEDLMAHVWAQLTTQQKTAIKSLIHAERDAA